MKTAADIYVGKNVGITIQVPVEKENVTHQFMTKVENEAVVRGSGNTDALAHGKVQLICFVGDSENSVDYEAGADYLRGSDKASIDWSPGGNEPTEGATYYVTYYYVSGTQFTVSNTPISDRDMDGVADEVAHVTVYKNGVEITPASVDDSTGVVTLSEEPDADDEILCSYRYDVNPYIAQELRVELNREIQGIDGLGSDKIQLWTALLKNLNGTIREVFHSEDQLRRLPNFRRIYRDKFDNLDNWEGSHFELADGWLYAHNVSGYNAILKNLKWFDAIIKMDCKVTLTTGWCGIAIRYPATDGEYEIGFNSSQVFAQLHKGTGSDTLGTHLFSVDKTTPGEYKFRLHITGFNIQLFLNNVKLLDVEDTEKRAPNPGQFSVEGINSRIYADNLEIRDTQVEGDYGLIVSWDDGQGHVRKIGLDGVTFPSGSLPTPKNEPVFVETPFQAKNAVVIS